MMIAQTVIVNANAIVLMLQKIHRKPDTPIRLQKIKTRHRLNLN